MQRRKLGRTGLDVSPIAIGGAAFSYVHHSTGWDPMAEAGRTVVYETLNTALDRGINYVVNSVKSEQVLGRRVSNRREA